LVEAPVFTQTSEYALRAVTWLAMRSSGARTTGEIAEGARVPASYLSKVLQTLSRAGIVRSQRGLGGGFTLARPAEELNVLDVVNAVDPIERIHCCPLGVPDHEHGLCRLHHRLDASILLIQDCLRSASIASLCTGNPKTAPMGLTSPRESGEERHEG